MGWLAWRGLHENENDLVSSGRHETNRSGGPGKPPTKRSVPLFDPRRPQTLEESGIIVEYFCCIEARAFLKPRSALLACPRWVWRQREPKMRLPSPLEENVRIDAVAADVVEFCRVTAGVFFGPLRVRLTMGTSAP